MYLNYTTNPAKPPRRVLSTLQTQPRQGKAALHLSSCEVSNAGAVVLLHFSTSIDKAVEARKQQQKINLLYRAFPVNFWSSLFKWVTSDMVFHIQAEDIVTGHSAGYTCNANSPQNQLQLMVIAFLTDLGICSYD